MSNYADCCEYDFLLISAVGLVGGVAQWLARRSLAGGLCLIRA